MTDTIEKKAIKKIFHGIVASNSMEKTLVVQVARLKKYGKYGKYSRYYKKYKVHNPEKKFKVGDAVSFVECRPISKEKRWKVIY